MQATMVRNHRAARFGPHQLEAGELVTDSEGERGTLISDRELLHHLKAGNATAVKGGELERAVAPEPERAVERPPAPTPKRGRGVARRRGRKPKR